MSCSEWGSEELLDYTLGRSNPADEAGIRRHAAACAACRSTLEDLAPFAFPGGRTDPLPGPGVDRAVRELIRQESERRGGSRTLRPTTRRLRLLRAARAGRPDAGLRAALLVTAAAALFALLLVSALRTPSTVPAGSAVLVERPRPLPAPLVPPAPPTAIPPEPPRATPLPDPATRPAPSPVPAPDPAPRPLPPPVPSPAPPAPPTDTVPIPRPVLATLLRSTGRLERGRATLPEGAELREGETLRLQGGWAALEFPDGSRAVLRAGAQLALHRSEGELLIRLTEGEIGCSVVKQAARRFRVETPHGTVAVLGTVFSVRAASASASVAVARGRVEARSGPGSAELAAGERSSMSRTLSPSKPEPVPVEKQFGWLIETGMVDLPQTIYLTSVSPGVELRAPTTRSRLFAQGSLGGEPAFGAVDARTLPGFNGRFLPPNRDEAGSIRFAIELRHEGEWALWARLLYPASGAQLWKDVKEPVDNDPNSFYASVDGGPERVLGNLKFDPDVRASGYRRWHWAGDGSVEVGRPKGLELGRLGAGRHVIRIRPRDPVETSTLHLSPRLDAICLSSDPAYRPRDEDFRR
jgi:hypothetical protein